MASHEGILGSLRPGDFKSHQYVNVDDKRHYRYVIAFNPGDITVGNLAFFLSWCLFNRPSSMLLYHFINIRH